jgi:zinc transport system substrate-binding protein
MQAAEEHEEAGEEPEYDEHIWTSPKNAMLMVDAIADALSSADSANAGAYAKNAADYTARIQQIDDRIKGIVDKAQNKLLVVADRFPFRYLTEEFGLKYCAAFSGCSSESDVSLGTMAYLINKVEENHIPYIYYIEFSNQKVAQAVAEQTGAQTLLLHSCHNVTKADFDAGVTYVSLMAQNADNLEKGLD